MIRVVIFLVAVGVIAFAAAWFADRPGGVEIVWLNYRVSTSVAVLVGVVLLLIALVMFVWSVLRTVLRAPGQLTHSLRARREAKGERAITRGFIAVGAGDLRGAKKYAEEARRVAGGEPLTLLLGAQSAQLAGDRDAAERVFRTMAERKDLKAIGLHGLFVEARRRNDFTTARALAEEAAKTAPSLGWAGQAVLEFRCATGDWSGALDALERNMASGLIDKPRYRRQRAVLLTAQAQTLADGAREQAAALATEAAKLAPDLVPAAALAGRLHADAGNMRKASRMLDAAWKANPHPDLAESYINLRPGDSARERLARAQKLARQPEGHIEGALALARAAIDAQSFATARVALEPFTAAPTQRVALLMAELEETESGDVGRARAWMARAVHAADDPVWTADGFVSEEWKPVSPATGRLDAFEWKVPVAELPGAVIDQDARTIESDEPPTVVLEAQPAPEPAEQAPMRRARTAVPQARPADRTRRAETVIPLMQAPDDPGPPEELEEEPVTPPKSEGWSRWFR
jgi:HemY protein